MSTNNIFLQSYITAQDLEDFGYVSTQLERDKKIPEVLPIASLIVNQLSGNRIVRQYRNDISTVDETTRDGIKLATYLEARHLLANGVDVSIGSSSFNIGSVSASVTQSNSPYYIPPQVIQALQAVNLYTYTTQANPKRSCFCGNCAICKEFLTPFSDQKCINWDQANKTLIRKDSLVSNDGSISIQFGVNPDDKEVNIEANIVGSKWTSPDASIAIDNTAKTLKIADDIELQLETIGNVADLTTQNKRDLVSAVNEVNAKTSGKTYTGGTGIVVDNNVNTVSLDNGTQVTLAQVATNTNAIATNTGNITALQTKVGTATLNTTAKDLSGAVNELNTKPAGKTYTPGDTSISIDNTANTIKVSDTLQTKVSDIETAVSTLQDNQGSLSNLVTPDKTTLVNAINDSFGVGTKARQEIGTLASLTTQAKDNLVDAVNEVNNKPAGNIYPQLKTDLVAGSNITIQANDTNSTLTISSVGGVAPDIYPQLKTDILGGTNVTIVPDDTNKTITINSPQRTYTAADNSLVFNQIASSIAVSTDIQNKVGTIGAVNTLKTTNKTNTVGAINEVFDATTQAINNVGQLSALTTTAKTSTVAAINEVNSKAKSYTSGNGIDVDNSANTIALNQDTTDALAQIGTDKGRIDTLITNVGDVSLLNTQAKEVVTAINEVLVNEGPLTSLTTSDKTNLVDAINEVNAKVGPSLEDAKFTNIPGTPTGVRLSNTNDDGTTGVTLYGDGGKVISVPSGKQLFVSANSDAGIGVNGQALTKGFSLSEAGGMVLTGINLTGLTTPTVGNQAASKDYVDSKVSPVDVYTQTKAIVQGNPTIVVTPDDTAKTLTLSAPQVTTNTFNIGTMTDLTTTNKTTLVNAINEINAKPSGGGKDWIQFQDQTAWTYDSGNKVWNANTPLTDGSYKVVIYSSSSYYTILLDNTNNNGFGVILANITPDGIDFIKFLPNQLALLNKPFDETTSPILTANGNETFTIYKWQFPI